jgi:hypothetical protein
LLEPLYQPGVEKALDDIENDPERRQHWNSTVRVLRLICESPDSPMARRHVIPAELSAPVWRVPIPAGHEDQNYAVLWSPSGTDAVIHYVGVWPPPSSPPR